MYVTAILGNSIIIHILRLMKAGSLVYYVNDDAVPQDGSHIHDAQWDGDLVI